MPTASFLGVPYPVVKNPLGLLQGQGGVSQIQSDLLVLLLTNPGERVFLPTFGTPLRTLVFDPNDITLAAKAQAMITQAIKTWEPRIAVQNITVTTPPNLTSAQLGPNNQNIQDIENVLLISIKFVDPGNIASVQTLVLELPLTGGAT